MIELGPNRYGKSAIRLVKVIRGADGQQIRDLTIAISLQGEFARAHVAGDNSGVVATDTMKNTTYALAREHLTGPIEHFGRVLAEHFAAFPQVATATVTINEHAWTPIPTNDGPARDAFVRTERADPDRRRRSRRRGDLDQRRLRRPHPDEDLEVGLQRLPPRRVHDPGRDRRPADGQPDQRQLALRAGGRSISTPPSTPSARRSSMSSRSIRALGPGHDLDDRPGRPGGSPRDRRDPARRCPTSTTGWWISRRSGRPTIARSTSRRASPTA